MGTRAQFFVGNPQDISGRVWLGCVAWDGYPDGDCGQELRKAKTERQFRNAVGRIAAKRDDFCDPAERSFPFPWKDDLFLTDCTYAWFDGAAQYTSFHRGFTPLVGYDDEAYYADDEEKLPGNVPAPSSELPPGPDSIMVVSVR